MSVDARVATPGTGIPRQTAPAPENKAPEGPAGAVTLRWLLPIRPLQAALWEIAGIAVLLAYTLNDVTRTAQLIVASAAGLLFLVTSVRFAGKHAAGWLVTWLGYRLRRHDNRRDSPDPLHRVAGAVRVRQHVDRAGNRFGVAEIDDGWSAIVRLTQGPGSPSPVLLTEILRRHYRSADIPLASAQLLTWAVPRAHGVFRVRWLAVRYRPEEAPIAALARGGGELGALRTTACAALSLMGSLVEAGYESTVLEAGELANELRVALGAGDAQAAVKVTDGWRSWTAGRSSQVCWAPRAEQGLARILDLAVPGAAFTATSYTLSRTPGGKERSEVTLRVGARADAPTPGDPGVAVVPLHGGHAAAVRRTLPLAL